MVEKPYAIVQTKHEQIDPDVLAAALLEHVRWPRADVLRVARKTRGILGVTFSEAEARGICQRLSQAGFPVQATPTERLLKLPRPRRVAWLECADDVLRVPTAETDGATIAIPWNQVFVVHAASMATEQMALAESPDAVYGGPAATAVTVESHAELHPTLGLVGVTEGGEMQYVRLSLQRFLSQRMPWLPAGATREQQFRAVLGAIVARSAAASISPEARKMVVLPLREVGLRTTTSRVLQDERTFQAEMDWLLQLLALRHAE